VVGCGDGCGGGSGDGTVVNDTTGGISTVSFSAVGAAVYRTGDTTVRSSAAIIMT